MEALAQVERPRIVTRGQQSQLEFGIHWLRGSMEHTKLDVVVKFLNTWFGHAERRTYGWWGYDRSIMWDIGISLHFHSTETAYGKTGGRFTLECPGSVFDGMDWERKLGFLSWLSTKFDLRPSRLDVFMDDFARTITPKALFMLVYGRSEDEGDPRCDFTHFRRVRLLWDGGVKGCTGVTAYFGKLGNTGSGKCLAVYDKALESDNENTAVRWELRTFDEIARDVFARLISAVHDAANDLNKIGKEGIGEAAAVAAFSEMIAGCIDFVKRTDRAGDKNLERLERLAFWQSILDRLGHGVRLARTVLRKTIERAVTYIETQAMGTIQTIRKAKGDQSFFAWFFDRLDGENRMKARHERAVRDYLAGLEGLVS